MDIIKGQKDITINIKREEVKVEEEKEKPDTLPEETVSRKKEKKKMEFDKVSLYVFYALIFLLPVFVLPLAVSPVISSKVFLFYGGVILSVFFLLLFLLQKGSVKIARSPLFFAFGGLVIAAFLSSLFSGNSAVSLVGKLSEINTFSMTAFAFLAMVMTSLLFQSEKRAFNLYMALFISAIGAFAFQLFYVLLDAKIIPLNIFQNKTANLIGGWNDFSIFFGLTGLISLVFLEIAGKSTGIIKAFFYSMLAMSVLALAAGNFFHAWTIFGSFALLLFLFGIFRQSSGGGKKIAWTSLVVVFLALFFIFGRGVAGKIGTSIGLNFAEVRPSWTATWNVSKEALKSEPLLGTGPNTFAYNWMKYKPAVVNNTIFWNSRFNSGVGYVPSLAGTLGIVGFIGIAGFLVILLSQWKKSLPSAREMDMADFLTFVSFLSSVYLWIFMIIYTPGPVIISLAFVMTGLFLGLLVKSGKIRSFDVSFAGGKAYVSGLIAVMLLGSITLAYLYTQKLLAVINYGRALEVFASSGDAIKTNNELLKAIKKDKQDEYYRTLSELSLIYLNQLAANKDMPREELGPLFQNALSSAITSAKEAVNLNPEDTANWMQLGRVYEMVVPLKIEKADEYALDSYAKAGVKSPLDPSPYVASARVVAQTGKLKEVRGYLNGALRIKPDYVSALYMLAQLESEEGNLKEAISRVGQVAAISQDAGSYFQLGLMNYQNKDLDQARMALERAVGLNSEYANARYFLGLIYDRQGLRDKAMEQFKNIEKNNPDNEEVKKILANLASGKTALAEISPAPEKRDEPPVKEKETGSLKKR
ncbi:hypothetical protein C4572_02585 [Candidatus Parcubacteria bacterium]|nr:MAG: hypothetical protein C4572_02585 [Candidatus Parcubacteria bacterium]